MQRLNQQPVPWSMMIDVNRANGTRGAIGKVHVRNRCSGFGSSLFKASRERRLFLVMWCSGKLAAMQGREELGIRGCTRFLPLVQ